MNAIRDSLPGARTRLLVIDDEENHCWMMGHAFEKRGYDVRCANSVCEALDIAQTWQPERAILDLRISDASGLPLIPRLRAASPGVRIVVLTGYSSVATAVEAIKLGATYYLTKPVEAEAVEAAFQRDVGDESVPLRNEPLSLGRLAWEHIHAVLAEHEGNITAAARTLGLHRRTLQRKLVKFPARR